MSDAAGAADSVDPLDTKLHTTVKASAPPPPQTSGASAASRPSLVLSRTSSERVPSSTSSLSIATHPRSAADGLSAQVLAGRRLSAAHAMQASASSSGVHLPLRSALRPPHFELNGQPASHHAHHSHDSSPLPVESPEPHTSGASTPGYKVQIAFDLLDEETRTGGGTGLDASFTLRAKSEDYERTKASREFLVCTDMNEYSMHALDWTLANVIEDGDELVVLRVIEPRKEDATERDPDVSRVEAQQLMDSILLKTAPESDNHRSLSVIVESVYGPLHTSMQQIIRLYRPDSLIVGTRGKSDSMWRQFMGSTSRYALERSPVPVVVVRPPRKVKRALEKRAANPKRGSYAALVDSDSSRAMSHATTMSPSTMGPARGRSRERDPVAPRRTRSQDPDIRHKAQKSGPAAVLRTSLLKLPNEALDLTRTRSMPA